MALETLKDVKEIGGFRILHTNTNDYPIPNAEEERKSFYGGSHIQIDHQYNMIQFKMQMKPIKEAGVNGCQVETIIHTAMLMLKGLNENCISYYNENAISSLEAALDSLRQRAKNREERGVEGTNNA